MSNARKLADNLPSEGQLSNRNLIINGGMQVAQRGTSHAAVANLAFTLDRFSFSYSQDGAFTVTQDSSAPDGFGNSLKVDVTTADSSLAASQYLIMEHKIEAQNLQSLAFGTSSAKNFTLSFYVKSNKTGTYAANVMHEDNSSIMANLTYTINSANTWERKTLTFTGDTTGAINADNGSGFKMGFALAVGSTWTSGDTSASFRAFANGNYGAGQTVNILDSTSNEWFITGVQLEVGPQSTPFEHEPVGVTLSKCQRYYYSFKTDNQNGVILMHQDRLTNTYIGSVVMPTDMRANPTVTHTGMDRVHKPGIRYDTLSSGPFFSFLHSQAIIFTCTTTSSDVDSQTAYLGASSGGTINVDAEL